MSRVFSDKSVKWNTGGSILSVVILSDCVSDICFLFIAQVVLPSPPPPSQSSMLADTDKIRKYFSCPFYILSSKSGKLCYVF